MLIYNSVEELQLFLTANKHLSIGFVPTMGALHEGHVSLIKASQKKADLTICSIFINPIQFNKQEDLDNYPRTLEDDILKLTTISCDVLFAPTIQEMYPNQKVKNYEFGEIATIMEGEHRPGHFNGVANVIERFFNIINPNYAFFGEKDYQQLAIVKALTKQLNAPIRIIGCPIMRESNGLAMSSRNSRLSIQQINDAAIIFEALNFIKSNYKNYTITEHKKIFQSTISKKMITTEYITFADGDTLQPISYFKETNHCIVFVAVNIGKVRLIDNLTIFN